jgi:hypothetical protein
MPLEESTDVTLQDLRAIIHGLRMANLSFVEQDALDEIEAMIKELPHPEDLAQMADSPSMLKKLKEHIGGIMRLIETYSKRDTEYKARYKSRTGLPPRYKVLEWRSAMSNRELRNAIVKGLISLSAAVDEDGHGKYASVLLSCAKKVRDNELPVEELHAGTVEFLTASLSSGGLRKEAQALTDIDVSLEDVRNGLTQVGGWFDYMLESLKDKAVYLQQHPKTQKFMQQLTEIYRNLAQLGNATKEQTAVIDQSSAAMEQAMEQALVPQSIMVGGQPRQIEWVDDPDQPGWQMAVVNVDGKQFEVQEDESGSRSLKPLTPAEEAAVETVAPAESAATGETPTEGPAETMQSGQVPALEDLSRAELSTLIQQAVPQVWQEGYQGQAVANLSDDQMRQVIRENVGEKSLPGFIEEVQRAASKKTFNLKKFNVIHGR